MLFFSISNPKVITTDSLTKFCYDSNKDIAMNAIFSLGLVSAGTNNSRLAGQLRQLAAYYAEDTNLLLIVRITQGLLHMGKGLMTLNPVYSHNFLVNNVGIAGILIALTAFTEAESLICGKHQFLIYSLCLAMTPRMVMLVNENLEPLNTQVIVGQAVDIVGQSGNPRTITGFQVHKAPVLLAQGEKCELSTEEYIPYTDVLENVVIVKPNEEYERNKNVTKK